MFRIIRSRSKLVSIASNSYRNFNYQKDIYTKNLQINDDYLKEELNELNKFKIEQPNLYRFIKAYHQHGHQQALTNPIDNKTVNLNELNPSNYGLNNENVYSTEGLLFSQYSNMNLDEIETYLKNAYSDKMSIEFDFITSEEEKLWIAREFEVIQLKELDKNVKIEIAKLLLKSQVKQKKIQLK